MTDERFAEKKVLLAPLDPVHDVGAKLIARALRERGHEVTLLQPDLSPEEVVSRARQVDPDFIMVSRTISYGTPELLARFADMCDAAGLRSSAKLVVGGMSIRKETAQERFRRGFDLTQPRGSSRLRKRDVRAIPRWPPTRPSNRSPRGYMTSKILRSGCAWTSPEG